VPFSRLCADLLREGRPVRFRVGGPSMSPTIRDGDALTVAPLAPGAAAPPGAIVLYAAQQGLVAHRVVGSSRGTEPLLRVRADAPGSPEESVAPEQVIGQVVRVEREGRLVPLARSRVSGLARRLALRWRALVTGVTARRSRLPVPTRNS
jgi:hypothetical protein